MVYGAYLYLSKQTIKPIAFSTTSSAPLVTGKNIKVVNSQILLLVMVPVIFSIGFTIIVYFRVCQVIQEEATVVSNDLDVAGKDSSNVGLVSIQRQISAPARQTEIERRQNRSTSI